MRSEPAGPKILAEVEPRRPQPIWDKCSLILPILVIRYELLRTASCGWLRGTGQFLDDMPNKIGAECVLLGDKPTPTPPNSLQISSEGC